MKKTLFTFFTFTALVASAQNVGINSTGATPHPSAALDVSATNKGFLAPRVADTNAVAAPAEGLLIYDNSSKCYRYRNNVKWTVCIEMGSMNSGNSLGSGSFNGDPNLYSGSRHCNPFQASKDYDTVTTSLSGTSRVWITQNLGSIIGPSNFGDDPPKTWGCFFKRGLATPYWVDQIDVNVIYPSWNSNEPGVNTSTWTSATDPCRQQLGGAWRLPTATEWQNVINNTNSAAGGTGANIFPILRVHPTRIIVPSGALTGIWGGSQGSESGLWSSDIQFLSHMAGANSNGWFLENSSMSTNVTLRLQAQGAKPVRCLR